MILFVYGTLKRGEKAHDLLRGQKFLGDAITLPHYRIVDLGPYPTLIESIHGLACRGELWQIDDACLKAIDVYEGAPDYYRRMRIDIDGFDEPAFAYFRVEPLESDYPTGDFWPL